MSEAKKVNVSTTPPELQNVFSAYEAYIRAKNHETETVRGFKHQLKFIKDWDQADTELDKFVLELEAQGHGNFIEDLIKRCGEVA